MVEFIWLFSGTLVVGWNLGRVGYRVQPIFFVFLIFTVAGLFNAHLRAVKEVVFKSESDELMEVSSKETFTHMDTIAPVPDGIKAKVTYYAEQSGINPDLYHALIHTESLYNPLAESPVGARGLGQVMPSNASGCGITKDDLWDVEKNLKCSTQILNKCRARYANYPQPKATELMLACYNAGPNAVQKYGFEVPPYPETKNYVHSILSRVQKKSGSCHSRDCLFMKYNATAGGETHEGVFALAAWIQTNVAQFNQFTGFNDLTVDGKKVTRLEPWHTDGLAVDVTINNNSKSQEVIKQIQAISIASGVKIRIANEIDKPGSTTTGPHIHLNFEGEDAAEQFLSYCRTEGIYG